MQNKKPADFHCRRAYILISALYLTLQVSADTLRRVMVVMAMCEGKHVRLC
jgi:hypothetical protein